MQIFPLTFFPLCLISLPYLAKGFLSNAIALRFPNIVNTRVPFPISTSPCDRSSVNLSSRLLSISDKKEVDSEENRLILKKFSYGVLWFGLIIYAFFLSPGGSPEAASVDSEIVKHMLTKLDGTYTPIFSAVFNLLGVAPIAFASVLFPGSKNQKVPALPFVLASVALGFFGLGPYLALREEKIQVGDSEKGFGTSLLEFKLTSVALFLSSLYLYYFAFFSNFDGNRWSEFFQLFSTQRLVHVSTVDFTILSLAVRVPYELIRSFLPTSSFETCCLVFRSAV